MIAAAVAVAGTAAVGVAGASGSSGEAPATVYAIDNGGPCFANMSKAACGPGETAQVSINTGETVTWNFDNTASGQVHNAGATNDVPADPAWKNYHGEIVSSGSYSRTFNQPGTYEFRCDVHPVMTGTITVTGAPVETPTTTPTTTATPTATPSTQPSDPGMSTPPPTGGAQDLVKPTLQSIGTTTRRRAVTVRFRLSENATVTIRVKRGGRVVKSVVKQLAAGRRSVSVRSSKLRKGRYKVEVRARDAGGNVSTLAAKSFRIRR